jgi:hypothetical protein
MGIGMVVDEDVVPVPSIHGQATEGRRIHPLPCLSTASRRAPLNQRHGMGGGGGGTNHLSLLVAAGDLLFLDTCASVGRGEVPALPRSLGGGQDCIVDIQGRMVY